uniref:DDE Tnp4 domain-containing protein n=1 Tax=Anopheles epiroticus TaxID=199890 RepID=A0A182PWM2_9DIPT
MYAKRSALSHVNLMEELRLEPTDWLNYLRMDEDSYLWLLERLPKNPTEWKKIGNDFNNKWQFPNCLGAVDGKHVRISPPSGGGSQFFNYKKFNSIVLMAVVDANYRFIMCDVGGLGSDSDGACIQATSF